MKKTSLFLSMLLCASMLAGCAQNKEKPDSFETAAPGKHTTSAQETIAAATPKTPRKSALTAEEQEAKPVRQTSQTSVPDGWEIVREYTADLNGDGQEDVISLYTSAIKEDGEFLWDDSHGWLLEIKTAEDQYYPLYQTANGRSTVYFSVGEEYGEETTPLVYVYRTSGAGVIFEKYTFQNGNYIRRTVYDSEKDSENGINLFYSSMEGYR